MKNKKETNKYDSDGWCHGLCRYDIEYNRLPSVAELNYVHGIAVGSFKKYDKHNNVLYVSFYNKGAVDGECIDLKY